MIFLTSDERPFKEGDYIIMQGMECLPTAPDTTYIVFNNKVKDKDIAEWIDIVSFRLVFVVDKVPKLSKKTKDSIIIHDSLLVAKESYNKAIQAMFKFSDRQYVHGLLRQTKTPVPLAVAWMKANCPESMQTWRRMAAVMFTLPDTYCHAIMAFCVPTKGRNPDWPKGSKKGESHEPPMFCRETDIYTQQIIESSVDVRNEIRETSEPKQQNLITKRSEPSIQWL